ncbi:MAG: DUF86 domain-containing protein [Pirellulales bacterium]
MSRERWQQRIQDILDAVAETESFIAGMDRDQFLADAKTLKAVTANLTVIGEAARHVPQTVAQQWPEIPWDVMCGMRNRIVHGYYQVDPTIVWDTCQNDLPALVIPLRKILQDNP